MLLRTKLAKHANVKMNLPIVGEVQLVNGIVDVPEHVHKLMIGDGLNEWTSGEQSAVEDTKNSLKKDDQIDHTPDQFEEMVGSLSFEEVVDLAKEAKIKSYQLFAKNEQALRTYVIKKLREAEEDRQIEELEKANELSESEEFKNL